jgi:hypothetical protein
MADFQGHNDKFTQMDLTTEHFAQIATMRGMRMDNVERFVYEWRGHHPEEKEIPKMWRLLFMKLWHEDYYATHLYQFFKYGMMDEQV